MVCVPQTILDTGWNAKWSVGTQSTVTAQTILDTGRNAKWSVGTQTTVAVVSI